MIYVLIGVLASWSVLWVWLGYSHQPWVKELTEAIYERRILCGKDF
jgi:hypothetical protein